MKKSSKNIILVLMFLIPNLVLISQIYFHTVNISVDSLFHFNRYYDTMMQIKNFNYQDFISMYGYSSSARIVNAVYGPIVAYFFGFILLITGSWFKFQVISIIILNLISTGITYFVLKKNGVEFKYRVIITIMYVLGTNVTKYMLSMAFTGIGAILFPLTVDLCFDFLKEERFKRISILKIALIPTILIQTHMLTFLESSICLIIAFIVGVWTSDNKSYYFKKIGLAILIFLVLSLNIFNNYLELIRGNHLIQPILIKKPSLHHVVGKNILKFINFSELIALFFVFAYTLKQVLQKRKIQKEIYFSLGIITIFLILSSKIIPWDYLFVRFPLITFFQFPKRFLVVALGFLIIVYGLIITKTKNIIFYFLTLLLVINTGSTTFQAFYIMNQKTKTRIIYNKNLTETTTTDKKKLNNYIYNDNPKLLIDNIYKGTTDYLPTNNNLRKTYYSQYNHLINTKEVKQKYRKYVENQRLYIVWENKSSLQKFEYIPIINYKNTNLKLNGKDLKTDEIKVNNFGVVKLPINKGKNKLEVSYKPSLIFKVLKLINIIGWIFLLIYIVYYYGYLKNKRSRVD